MISEDLFLIIPIEPQNVKGSMIGVARILIQGRMKVGMNDGIILP